MYGANGSIVRIAEPDWSGMSDLVSRQALCDYLREYKIHLVPISSDESEVKGYNDGINLAISVITKFPSAEPERKTGEWIKIGHWGRSYRCDQCGNTLDFDGGNVGRGGVNFCPNCGAKMRGDR